MFLKPAEPEAPVSKCSTCSESATPGEVWGYAVCDDCFGRWFDEAPNAGEAEKLATKAQLEKAWAKGQFLSEFYLDWTAAWMKRNQRAVAA